MADAISSFFIGISKSLPARLLVLHFKRNQVLLLFWLFLFVVIFEGFGQRLGIPYLFLDPEYLNEVGFRSYFIMGLCLGGFAISFHITTYIKDGPRFNFLGWLNRPFMRFTLNNSLIPLMFLILYTWQVIDFQQLNGKSAGEIAGMLGGLFTGYFGMVVLLLVYFRWTNKDIFKYVVCKLDEKLKSNVPATRARALSKLDMARKRQIEVTHYLDLNLAVRRVPDYKGFYDRFTVLQVFDQNHFNLVSVELFIFVALIVLGIFSDYPVFQIPAAASAVLLMTILIMLTGALIYWFKGWSFTIFIVTVLAINLLIKFEVITKDYRAFGLDYSADPAIYTLDSLESTNSTERIYDDMASTRDILNKWRRSFPDSIKPKMVFICASGGGQRSLIWTLNALQTADSITGGRLMPHARLITGASGGLIGAAYFRELYYRDRIRGLLDARDELYLHTIARDNLNPVIFSLLVNDMFFSFQRFEYNGYHYRKDRGYAFEEQLNKNSLGMMDKSLYSYRQPEMDAEIPMLLLAPTIINDGRKLFISPVDISYMNRTDQSGPLSRIKGIEFREFFRDQGADSLRFLSALRMSATFPYVTPNVTLPSQPAMEIMDAGLTDNFGIADATRFLYVFSDWVEEHTSGVIFLTIRDSQKNSPVSERESKSLFQKFISPIQGFYRNFENLQDISNDFRMKGAEAWFDGEIHTVLLEYNSANNPELKKRASLNWRLTDMEKQSIIQNIQSEKNRFELEKLRKLLGN